MASRTGFGTQKALLFEKKGRGGIRGRTPSESVQGSLLRDGPWMSTGKTSKGLGQRTGGLMQAVTGEGVEKGAVRGLGIAFRDGLVFEEECFQVFTSQQA